MRRKTLISWSSGKDSAWTLHLLSQDPSIEIVGLVCTVNKKFNRVSLHGVRIELLEQQARNVNLPLYIVYIPHPCDNAEYVKAMNSFICEAKASGVEYLAFGDLFLKNVRIYREELLKNSGITPLFPIWGISTKFLAKQMISSGLKCKITCVNPKHIAKEFAGRDYDNSFLNDIPEKVDPCGENGEFHSFVYDGPMFQHPINITVGETIKRNGFCFTDLFLSTYKISNSRISDLTLK